MDQKEGTVMNSSLPPNPNQGLSFEGKNLKEIWLAGGCFWGVQSYFARIYGVAGTTAGYANGNTAHPTYEDVCRRNTGHAETVRVRYDPERVSLATLLDHFFRIIDPTALNRQGNDRGIQYRSGIYYQDERDLPVIRSVLAEIRKQYQKPVVTEVLPLTNFYPAEEYHQDYLDKHPGGYCHIDFSCLQKQQPFPVDPARYLKPDPESIQKTLTDIQYSVTQLGDTEPPYHNPYWDHHEPGLYVDVTTGEPLFSSRDKFASGCGWPSFTKPLDSKAITYKEDLSHGMRRTETRSRVGDAHLGHVFEDGPPEQGGRRFCINSAALRFIPLAEMEKAGYGEFIPLVQ
jgi:peptide methionine sulfoxide reductase msrA/msrB